MDYNSITCPACGNENMAPVIYGYPSESMIALARQEVIALGGTSSKESGPTHYCYSCNEVATA